MRWAHKGRVLAHKAAEYCQTKQCTLVSLLFHCPPCGPSVSHTECQLLHRVEKPAVELLTFEYMLGRWCVGKTSAFFLFPLRLSVLPFWNCAQCDSWHWLCGLRWFGYYPVVGVLCEPGAATRLFPTVQSLMWAPAWRSCLTGSGTFPVLSKHFK